MPFSVKSRGCLDLNRDVNSTRRDEESTQIFIEIILTFEVIFLLVAGWYRATLRWHSLIIFFFFCRFFSPIVDSSSRAQIFGQFFSLFFFPSSHSFWWDDEEKNCHQPRTQTFLGAWKCAAEAKTSSNRRDIEKKLFTLLWQTVFTRIPLHKREPSDAKPVYDQA